MPRGIGASAGVVIGNVLLLEQDASAVMKRSIKKEGVSKEIFRFEQALLTTKQQFVEAKAKAKEHLSEEQSVIFNAYELILKDKLLRDATMERIKNERVNAEFALSETLQNLSKTFENINNEYLRERGYDITQVGQKILRNLQGAQREFFLETQKDVVIVAQDLTPADTVGLQKGNVIGFVTELGSKTSHTAILAEAMQIPAVVGMKGLTQGVKTGDKILVDGYDGWVIINPQKVITEYYFEKRRKILVKERALRELKNLPAITRDGRQIELAANIEIPEELPGIAEHGAEGVGLFRTEYLFINRARFPSEEEQFEDYSKIAKEVFPKTVIFRTLDMGGDKLFGYLDGDRAGEKNPFLGLRAIRFCLKYPEFFIPQLKAILRASARKNVKIMYPMISGMEEVINANRILEECKAQLRQERKEFDPEIKVGVMIEIPSAALTAEIISRYVDFLSIGTNDLIQYTIAADRINTNVAYLYNPLHCAILRLLKQIVESGHQNGKWVGLCGEMASDPAFTKILVGLGIDEFSMPASAIPRIKKIIRTTTFEEVKAVVNEILTARSQNKIKKLIKRISPKEGEK